MSGRIEQKVKSEITYIRRRNLEHEIEWICLEFFMKKEKALIFGVECQPPNNLKSLSKLFQDRFLNRLSKVNPKNNDSIVDFNNRLLLVTVRLYS